MTNRDIFNYVSFKTEFEQLINRYIEQGLSATILLPIVMDAYTSMNAVSRKEIEEAIKEIKAESEQPKEEVNEDCSECKVG